MYSMVLFRKVIKIYKIILKEKLLKVYLQEDEFLNLVIFLNLLVCRIKVYQISFNMIVQNLDIIFLILRNCLLRIFMFDFVLLNVSNV